MSTFSAKYDFLSPQRIVFGWGRRAETGALARTLGRRAFIVHGSRTLEKSGVIVDLCDRLRMEGVDAVAAGGVTHEPEVEDVDRIAARFRDHGAGDGDLVIAIGGGSAIDLAKAACAMATNWKSPTVAKICVNASPFCTRRMSCV